jgi:hypothetical protein
MSQKTFSVPNFNMGYFMAWDMYSQAAQTIKVKLKDDSRIYAEGESAETEIMPPLAQGSGFITGNALQLDVDIPDSEDLKSSINSYTIARADGQPVGFGFNLFVEDSEDNDYNDLYVSLICWKSKG